MVFGGSCCGPIFGLYERSSLAQGRWQGFAQEARSGLTNGIPQFEAQRFTRWNLRQSLRNHRDYNEYRIGSYRDLAINPNPKTKSGVAAYGVVDSLLPPSLPDIEAWFASNDTILGSEWDCASLSSSISLDYHNRGRDSCCKPTSEAYPGPNIILDLVTV